MHWLGSLSTIWIYTLFSAGIIASIAAQVFAFLEGPKTCRRQAALALGILATLALFAAGFIGSAKLRDYVNFVNARISSATDSLVPPSLT